MVYSLLRRRGETGRRAGLKILWTNHPCRFESDRRHQTKIKRTRETVLSSFYFFTSDYFGLNLYGFSTDSARLEKSTYAFYKLTFLIAGRQYGRILHLHSSIFGKFTLVYFACALYNIFIFNLRGVQ